MVRNDPCCGNCPRELGLWVGLGVGVGLEALSGLVIDRGLGVAQG